MKRHNAIKDIKRHMGYNEKLYIWIARSRGENPRNRGEK